MRFMLTRGESCPGLPQLFRRREYGRAQAKTIFRNLLDISATVSIEERRVVVLLDKRAHNPYLVSSGLANSPTPMHWFAGKKLVIEFS